MHILAASSRAVLVALVLAPLGAVVTAGPASALPPGSPVAVVAPETVGVEPVAPKSCPPPEAPGEPVPAFGAGQEPPCGSHDPRLPERRDDAAAPPAGGVADAKPGESRPNEATNDEVGTDEAGDAPTPSAGSDGPDGAVPAPAAGTNAPLSGPGADAPTNNLAWVGQAVRTRTKSTTAVVEIPAAIPVTGPVAINVRFGGRVVDQDYATGTGNRILHNYAGGLKRQETVNVRLTDRAAGVSYALDLTITIEPLHDVTVSSLHFQEVSECDVASEADPEIVWRNPEGNLRNARPLVGNGQAWIHEFGGTWTEIAVSDGLIVPAVYWTENDAGLPGWSFSAVVWGNVPEEPLLPTSTREVGWLADESDDDCNAYFTYTLTVTPRWYPNL